MSTATKASPPKPWERAGAGSSAPATSGVSSVSAAPSASNTSSNSSDSSSTTPVLPARPADMSNTSTSNTSSALTNSAYGANRYGSTTTGYGQTGAYGATGYGGSYGSSYASPYSRFGGGGYGGGYGGYGGGFGGGFGGGAYGSPYGGYGGVPGMPGDMSLTRQMEAGTQATFQLLQSVVSAFGGFAQMLESTYMATHSSFFAMIGVAEQFASLRTWLGEVLSVFALLRFVKRTLGWGGADASSSQQGGANGISAADFNSFNATGQTTPVGAVSGAAGGAVPGKPKVSKKPIVIFFLTVIGLPWLMNKLVKLITAKQQEQARLLGLPEGAIPPLMDHNGQPLPQHLQPPGVDLSFLNNNAQLAEQQRAQQEASIDPATLTFVRAQHPHTSNDQFELSFNKGDIIAVLTPKEERQEPGWWRGRLRDGSIGWFPSTHVQEIPMNNAQKKLEQPSPKDTKA